MAMSVHLPYYAANCTMPPPPYLFSGCYHGIPQPPSCRRLLPVVRPQPTRFVDEDLFGDDDTAGCHVM
ncbi:hypothetical protein GUJ93_ZPchr0010g8543 [Zizania palustris]|uniref:Uncharacterized protein n=1 Tax=Zizania palustris TaxID=103762 RepID=A0A8J6BPT2_ZIZPA|nr:hypothetical protein GUJ93_ZPchr0010g8543 [Zizania palustris]